MDHLQPSSRRWVKRPLPTSLLAMSVFYVMYSASFLPSTSQSSRIASWEAGSVPTMSSYVSTIGNSVASQDMQTMSQQQTPLTPHFLKRTNGVNWKMWDRTSILHNDKNLTCNWNDYRPFIGRGQEAPAVQFCAHPLSDDQFVSNNIVKKGRHLECDALPKLLSHTLESRTDDSPAIYVDVGANIGTCVMQMLLTTDATIMAFEPHPYNLFVMTSTFMKLDEKYRNRIHLFPIALGADSSESTIHMASDNRGHAVVSKVIRINNKATFLPPMAIRVEPLDSIIKKDAVVHLMKMDAQGFECYIFDGMKQVLKKTKAVFFELEKKVLNGFDHCSPNVLWDKFTQAEFSMHIGGLGRKETKQMPDKGKVNIVALHP